MAMTACIVDGCTRWARTGQYCSIHKPQKNAQDRPAPPPGAGFFGVRLAEQIEKVKEHASEHGVDNEIGILRLTLHKLLTEEDDPARLATGVAKLSAVIITALKAKRVIDGDSADSLLDAVATIVEELNP
jgi:hypothetical protein